MQARKRAKKRKRTKGGRETGTTSELRRGLRRSSAAQWLTKNPLVVFRFLVVSAAAVTIGVTWPLWQTRTAPPMLPVLPLPAVDLGLPLLGALILTLLKAGLGLAAYWALLAYGILIDQTRLQPQFISFGLLMAGTLGGKAGLTLARAHLITLWFYSGFNKLLSVDFMTNPDPWILRGLITDPPFFLRTGFPYLVIVAETGLGVAALLPRSRLLAAYGAVFVQGGILLAISPLGHNWNSSVWLWNIVLALSGFFLLVPWKESIFASLRATTPLVRYATVLLVLYPLGFYVGVTDAYLSHNLYSRNIPMGYVCDSKGQAKEAVPGLGSPIVYAFTDVAYRCRPVDTLSDLNVPVPPIHRVYESYFQQTCRPNDILIIHDKRRFFRARRKDDPVFGCRRSE